MKTDNNILTGQYVRIEQMPAKTALRFFALLIDWLVLVAYFYVVIFVDDYLHLSMSTSSTILFVVLPILLYQPVCETLTGGQTLGKFLLRTRVVCVDGSSPSMGDFLLRWLLLPIDLLFFGGVAAFTMLVSPRRQRLGDMAAGTMVIQMKGYDKIRISLDDYVEGDEAKTATVV